jgi:hypothetical protein
MTEKLQRMTTNPTFSNPILNCSKNRAQKSQTLPPAYGRFGEDRIEGRIKPRQEKKKSEHPTPCRPGCPLSTSILHGLIVKLFPLRLLTTVAPPPPPLRHASCQPSLSSASAAANVHHLHHRTFVDCCFCHCCQRCCRPSATSRTYLSFAPSAVSLQPPSSTSSYRHC